MYTESSGPSITTSHVLMSSSLVVILQPGGGLFETSPSSYSGFSIMIATYVKSGHYDLHYPFIGSHIRPLWFVGVRSRWRDGDVAE